MASVPVASEATSGIETLKQKLPEVGKVALARRVVACGSLMSVRKWIKKGGKDGRRTKSEVLEVLAGSEELPVAQRTVTGNQRHVSEPERDSKS